MIAQGSTGIVTVYFSDLEAAQQFAIDVNHGVYQTRHLSPIQSPDWQDLPES